MLLDESPSFVWDFSSLAEITAESSPSEEKKC